MMMPARIFAASRITSGLRVSMDTGAGRSPNPCSTGAIRRSSSSALTGSEPGLVEFPADIDEICACLCKSLGATDRRLWFAIIAAIRKTVGRDVHNGHDPGGIQGNAGNGGARGGHAIDKVFYLRFVDRLHCACANDGVFDAAGFPLPKPDSAERNGTARQGQSRAKRDRITRNLAIKQSNRLKI